VLVRAGQRDEVELTGKAAALVALVALEGQAERRHAAHLLWPNSPEGQARNNLRTLVHRLNQRVGAELLSGTERLVLEVAQAAPQLDIDALLSALQAGAAGHELLAQAGVQGEASEVFGQWLSAARQQQRRQQLAALSPALQAALAQGQAQRAVALARACVQLEPLSEHWHRQLMDTLARCGDRAAALAAYEECKERLLQQLGVMPDTQTRTVQLRILQGQSGEPVEPVPSASTSRAVAAIPARVATTASVAARLTPLRGAARYPLIERESVLTEILSALGKGQHVALHGEAGVGKTRLLRHLAEQCELEQVAIQLGSREEPYAALAQLLQDVQTRRVPHVGLPEQVELAPPKRRSVSPIDSPDRCPQKGPGFERKTAQEGEPLGSGAPGRNRS
jgi:DNA-binding SARP family transcriptional activator